MLAQAKLNNAREFFLFFYMLLHGLDFYTFMHHPKFYLNE